MEEAQSPKVITDSNSSTHPQVIISKTEYLSLDYLVLRPLTEKGDRIFARKLANMHNAKLPQGKGGFGFPNDNHIGLMLQGNAWETNWCLFFCKRLKCPT